jgi:hypothetical protein
MLVNKPSRRRAKGLAEEAVTEEVPLLHRIPFSRDSRADLARLCVKALEHIPRLEIDGVTHDDASGEMIHISVRSMGGHTKESLQSEIRAAWKSEVVRDKTSLNSIRQTEEGFEFRFSVLDEGCSVTGVFAVTVS